MLSRVVSSPIHGNCSREICLITSGNVGPPGRTPSRISRSLMRSTPEISLAGVSPPLMTQGRNLRLGGCCFGMLTCPTSGLGTASSECSSSFRSADIKISSCLLARRACSCRPRQVGEGQALLLMRASDVVQIGAEVNDVQALRHS